MDPKRVLLSYLFFGLGIGLTVWQYVWLLSHGSPLDGPRQLFLIVINTLAVWVGALLAYPWGSGDPENRPPHYFRHYQWIKWISLIFCFASMLGIAISLLQLREGGFNLGAYFVASVYMVGYGLLGVGPDALRWSVSRLSAPPTEEAAPPTPPPKKRKIYPIASEFVIGRIRRPGQGNQRGGRE